MPVWTTNTIEDEPTVVLSRWRVIEVPDPQGKGLDRHFNGYNASDQGGRVSSKIVSFDPETQTGITRSGRKYQLLGEPGFHGDAHYVLRRWLGINKIEPSEVTDVTFEYLPVRKSGQ